MLYGSGREGGDLAADQALWPVSSHCLLPHGRLELDCNESFFVRNVDRFAASSGTPSLI